MLALFETLITQDPRLEIPKQIKNPPSLAPR
jgi:hypothetical protein